MIEWICSLIYLAMENWNSWWKLTFTSFDTILRELEIQNARVVKLRKLRKSNQMFKNYMFIGNENSMIKYGFENQPKLWTFTEICFQPTLKLCLIFNLLIFCSVSIFLSPLSMRDCVTNFILSMSVNSRSISDSFSASLTWNHSSVFIIMNIEL
jgi:hypothetical protein